MMKRILIFLLLATPSYAAPVITFNSTTGGSDVNASGSGGAAILAGSNNSAITTASSPVVNLSADAPDLSSLASPTGNEVMWVDTGSGRQWSVILSADNSAKTVTCADNFTAGNPLNWGIGGKRATLDNVDSRKLISADIKTGWTVRLESDQAITATTLSVAAATSGRFTIEGDSTTTLRAIDQTANAGHFTPVGGSQVIFRNIKFISTNITRTGVFVFNLGASSDDFDAVCQNCIFGDAASKITRVIEFPSGTTTTSFTFIDCLIRETTGNCFNGANASTINLYNTRFYKNAASCISINTTAAHTGFICESCVFDRNGGDCINFTQTVANDPARPFVIKNCVFHQNIGDAIDLSAGANAWENVIIINNTFDNNATGIKAISGADAMKALVDNNNFYTNTLDRSNIAAGPNDTALDPQFVDGADSVTANFRIGTNLKALGYPPTAVNMFANTSLTKSYVDIGAAQREETGGPGGAAGYSRSRIVNSQ